jgi:hypothetical protein
MFNYNQFKYLIIKNEKISEQINEVIDLISEEPIVQESNNSLVNQNNNLLRGESIEDISSYFKIYKDLDEIEDISEDKEVQLSVKELIHSNPNNKIKGKSIFM